MEGGGRDGRPVFFLVEQLCRDGLLDGLQPLAVLFRFCCVDEDP